MTDHGRRQASAAGRCLKKFQIVPDAIYTSLLRRSKETASEITATAGGRYATVPVVNSWRLNERHYGALVGLPKDLVGSVLAEVLGQGAPSHERSGQARLEGRALGRYPYCTVRTGH